MKIIFFTRRFFPLIGGVEKHCLKIGKMLKERGHSITVVTEGQENQIESEIVEGIKIFRVKITLGEKFKKFQIWWWLLKNRKLIEKSDIVHCHDVFFWYIPFRLLYPKKKVFTTFHGWEGICPPSKKVVFLRKIYESLSKGNICVGDYLQDLYGTLPDFITYGGAEQNIEKRKVRVVNNRIAFVGRLEQATGLLTYLRVIDNLGNKFKVVFVGDGTLRGLAEKYGKVFGFIKETSKIISVSRFIFVSSYLLSIEVMLKKKMIFAVYDNICKKKILEMAPFSKFIVIESDPKKLAEKVIYYYNHPEEEKKLVEAGYKWAKEQTWDKVVDIYLKLWQK